MRHTLLFELFLVLFLQSATPQVDATSRQTKVDDSSSLVHVAASGKQRKRRLAKHNCRACPNNVDLVCAEEMTFQNECYASCGTKKAVIIKGACDGDYMLASLMTRTRKAEIQIYGAQVSRKQMRMYQSKNFTFVGSTDFSNSTPNGRDPVLTGRRNETESAASKMEQKIRAVRITPKGHLYVSTMDVNDLPEYKGGGRFTAESVIGEDTRKKVRSTRRDPFKRICEIDYRGGQGGCTGSVIGRNHVLTAAHCVWSGSGFYFVSQVAPGRYRRKNGASVLQHPKYRWAKKHVTLYNTYLNNGYDEYDIAVIEVKEGKVQGAIGETVGTFELFTYECDVDERSRVTGYPADLLAGAMYSSGPCPGWYHECNDMRVEHQCDTFGGNSGSPIYDAKNRQFGVHTHGGSTWNSGVKLTKEHVGVLQSWML